jgi:beta-hydroxylase
MLYSISWAFSLKKYYKYFFVVLFIILIILPVYPILLPLNIIFNFLYKNGPFLENRYEIFPHSKIIEKNSKPIINEFIEFNHKYKDDIECIRKTTPGFNIEHTNDENNCWRSIYLKKSGVLMYSMNRYFPETIKLLQDKQIHNAFFSILDPGVEIPKHIGYYKGYLRYHLGVVIPNNKDIYTDKKPYIVCGDEKYYWKEGEGVLFDDMYMHYVKNPSNKQRVILYLDVKRSSNGFISDLLNDFGIFIIETSPLLNIFIKNQHSQRKIYDE